MAFHLENFNSVKTSVIFLVAISLCNANIQSVTTYLQRKSVWLTVTQLCRRFRKLSVWKSVTKKDRMAGALWQDITRPQKRVT